MQYFVSIPTSTTLLLETGVLYCTNRNLPVCQSFFGDPSVR